MSLVGPAWQEKKTLPIISAIFFLFKLQSSKDGRGKLQLCTLARVGFRPLMEKMLLLILTDHTEKQISASLNLGLEDIFSKCTSH